MSKTKLGYYIDSISKIEKMIFDEEFKKIGITFSQFKVLNWLWRHEELTQKEIHNFVQIKPSSLTKTLNILIDKGLIERTVDTDDGRVRKIRVTEASYAIESKAWKIIDGFDKRIKDVLDEEEYRITTQSLRKLCENL